MPDALQPKQQCTPVFLAPMAGASDLPFRKVALRFGASGVVSEMVASRELLDAKRSARARANLGLDEMRMAVQLAGRAWSRSRAPGSLA